LTLTVIKLTHNNNMKNYSEELRKNLLK